MWQKAIIAWKVINAYWLAMLVKYGYPSGYDFLISLVPTIKYDVLGQALIVSSLSVGILSIFGLGEMAIGFLLLVFLIEVVTGIWASKKRGEDFKSEKFSRFTLKSFFYLSIIAICYQMSISYESRGKDLGVIIFDFMHLFFTAQIVLEIIVSISENYSVITGKPKQHWINTMVDRVNKLLGNP